MIERIRATTCGAAILAGALIAAPAQAQTQRCQDLEKMAQQELDSASTLKTQAAKQAMQSGSDVLSKLGISGGGSGNVDQAIQKGALAASSPQMQNAILIQLASANAHLQEMVWRGCKPSSG